MKLMGECPNLGWGSFLPIWGMGGRLEWPSGWEPLSPQKGTRWEWTVCPLRHASAPSPAVAALAQCTLDSARSHPPGPCQQPAAELPVQMLRATEENPGQWRGAAGETGE